MADRAFRVIYRAGLRLTSADFRDRYGDEALDVAVERFRCAPSPRAIRAVREFVDLAVTIRRERFTRGASAPRWRETRMSIQDLRYALRALRRRPAFAVTAVLTLALGSAATTALFSVVDTALVKPLPYPEPDRLVTVMEASTSTTSKTSLIAPIRLEDWNRMNRTFVAVSGLYADNVTDTTGPAPERLAAFRVTPRYFGVYGAPPLIGRTFTPNEELAGGPTVAVLSEAFWTRRFARDPAALGRSLHMAGRVWTIVGIMPASFTSVSVDVWLPAQLAGASSNGPDRDGGAGVMSNRFARFLSGVGRLKPGVTAAEAQDDLNRVERELAVQFPASDAHWATAVHDLKTARIGNRAQPIWLLFGAVGVLWLIAVANVAALVLVEMRRRHAELAIRMALGASRGRLVGGVLQEILLLCLGAGVFGGVGAVWIVAAIKATFLEMPRVNELAVDARALVFAALTMVIAALACGGIPAVLATRRRPSDTLRGQRGVAGRAHRLQRMLVVAEVALSMILCASATLLVRSYDNLTHVDTGFQPAGVYTFHVGARWDENRAAVGQLQEQLVEQLGRQPGVEAVGLSDFLPESGSTLREQVKVAGIAGTDPNGNLTTGARTIGADYLATLKIPILAGTNCPRFRFDPNGAGVVLVNRRFVDQFGTGENLVGRELRFAEYGAAALPSTIIGVIGNVSEDSAAADVVPYVYTCLRPGDWPDPQYVVRLASATSLGALRQLVRTLDPSRAVFGYAPLGDVLRADTDEPRMDAGLMTLFAVTALGLSAISLYGLFMLIVAESRREIGVRLALGAAPRQMIGLVCLGAGRLLAAGLVIGLALTAAVSRVLRTLLYGISTHDAATLALAALTLAVVSSAAIALPALRAARTAPTEALRD